MPLKRRVRHGSNSSSSHVIKPAVLIANNSLTVSATNLKQNGSGISKQQQQLDRNNYLSSLTKDQLKVECRKRGQKTTGNKTELVLNSLIYEFCCCRRCWMVVELIRFCQHNECRCMSSQSIGEVCRPTYYPIQSNQFNNLFLFV